MRLESLERHWKFFQKELNDWRRELQAGDQPVHGGRRRAREPSRHVGSDERGDEHGGDGARAVRSHQQRAGGDRRRGKGGIRPDRQADQSQPAGQRARDQHTGRAKGGRGRHFLQRPPPRHDRLTVALGSGERSAAAWQRTQVGADGNGRRDGFPRRIQGGDEGLPDREVRAGTAGAAPAHLAQHPQPQGRLRRSRAAGLGPGAAPADLVLARAAHGQRRGVRARRADPDAPGGDVHRAGPGAATAAADRVRGARSMALRRHRPVPAASAVLPAPRESLLLPGLPGRTGAAVGRAAGLGAVEAPATCRCRVDHALAEVGAPGRLGSDCRAARRRRGEPDRQRLARRDADRRHPRERLRGTRAVRRRDGARLDHTAAAGAQAAVALPDRHAARRTIDADVHEAAEVRGIRGLDRRRAERVPRFSGRSAMPSWAS